MNKQYKKWRVIFVFSILAILAVYIIIVFAKISFMPTTVITETPPKTERGSILDRSGKPLAVSAKFYHLHTKPSEIESQQETIAELLAPLLNTSANQILSTIKNATTDFVYIKKNITESKKTQIQEALKANNIRGLGFDEISGRVYPENSLASHVIGFMGDGEIGRSGVEYSMQSTLSPIPVAVDGVYKENSNKGKNVYLTIDANLQYKLEKLAKESMQETSAESFMLIAASAKTGEILSYISYPEANLSEYTSSTTEERIDRPAVLAYEPGSVFKIFSVASFINAGVISENEKFVCDGKCEIVGANGEKAVITCLDHHGSITAAQALQYSCNDALAQMSQKIEAELFLKYIRNFGFGERTGIELPSETRGSVKTTKDRFWSIRSKPTISIGQEISVSALQMVQATTALTNQGTPVELSLISRITNFDGTVEYEHTPSYKESVVTPATANYLLKSMQTTARAGTGSRANLSDVSIGVKTGTAQMLDPETGGYSTEDFVSNCVAVFPVEDPEIILYIVITKAKGETYAGRIVAPVIGKAADVIIDHLGMTRANATSIKHSGTIELTTSRQLQVFDVLPDFSGIPKRLLTDLLSRTDMQFKIVGDGYVVNQYPAAGTPVTKGMYIELYLE